MSELSRIPYPGSRQAIDMGCSCPVMDNRRGEGVVFRGVAHFWYDRACPLHGEATNVADEPRSGSATPDGQSSPGIDQVKECNDPGVA